MTTPRTAAQQLLKACEQRLPLQGQAAIIDELNNLRAALAEPVEPVAYIHRQGRHWEVSERPLADDEKARGWTEEPLFTAPPQRKPLTDEEIKRLVSNDMVQFARAIERAHGITP